MSSQSEKAHRFVELHQGEPFIIPNPWDAGSARVFQGLGFKALATTSSGFAFTLGRLDSSVNLEEVVAHVESISSVTSIPLSVDLENGFGDEPTDAARAIAAVAGAGAVGGSIEDYDPVGDRLYDFDHAVERVAAAAEMAKSLDFPFTLTARAENHIRETPDLDDTIARLQAFEKAGADVLYAPGLQTLDQIRAVCSALSSPVNVLARPKLTVESIFSAGAQRISVGGSLTFVGVQAMVDAAKAMQERGDLSGLTSQLPLEEWLA